MREIKFRAWDEDRKKFHTSPTFQVDLNGVLSAKNSGMPHRKGYQKLEINQFSGLKTRAGVELYEGDICKQKRLGKDVVFEIIFRWGMFMAKIKEIEFVLKTACENDHNHGLPIEVIGNIYEDPELLE